MFAAAFCACDKLAWVVDKEYDTSLMLKTFKLKFGKSLTSNFCPR